MNPNGTTSEEADVLFPMLFYPERDRRSTREGRRLLHRGILDTSPLLSAIFAQRGVRICILLLPAMAALYSI
jgi:hypothetical protein